eukprot:TRINITY_DN20001_c0_g1_i2.p1 TRINITY_DN20001_c0_g1~~TRINITY_DN20001_c0_g1_i2.p1  ORF type:complete len:364 (+),score=113.33 TRINITY_DN20001_c0_g1_i2:65-1093(+)
MAPGQDGALAMVLRGVLWGSAGLLALAVAARLAWGAWRYPAAVRAVDAFYERWRRFLSPAAAIRPGRRVVLLEAASGAAEPRDAPHVTVFLFHGSCARMGQFEAQLEALFNAGDQPIRFITYDAVGCGRSECPADPSALSPWELINDACALFARMAGDGPCVLLGHSFGCNVALHVAARHPSRVRSLLLIGPPPPMAGREELRKALAVFRLPNIMLWLIRPLLAIGFQRMALAPQASAALRRQEAEASSRGSVHAFASYWRRMVDLVDHPVDYGAVAHIPCTIINGEQDKITPPAHAAALGKELPKAQLVVVSGAAHQVMQERAGEVTAKLFELVRAAASSL